MPLCIELNLNVEMFFEYNYSASPILVGSYMKYVSMYLQAQGNFISTLSPASMFIRLLHITFKVTKLPLLHVYQDLHVYFSETKSSSLHVY